ncbi:MAG: carotenoid biosynthesis protein [Cyclobacteriaceae bacterium]|nr:carotenoid biosynthesis protein [Cyclobacteriaceae bacterium]
MSEYTMAQKRINPKSLAIFVIWLFQVSAIIGISLGFQEWFITKTPFTLLLTGALLFFYYTIENFQKVFTVVIIFATSILVEWIGVHFGFLFGVYEYGNNLGFKIDGVPLLIGVTWTTLILCTAAIADHLIKPIYLKVLIGALLMVFIDFFIETSAPPFDFWIWEEGVAPIRNYIAWFGVSLVLHAFYHQQKMKGDFTFSCHIYAAQLLFFIYFYGFHRI